MPSHGVLGSWPDLAVRRPVDDLNGGIEGSGVNAKTGVPDRFQLGKILRHLAVLEPGRVNKLCVFNQFKYSDLFRLRHTRLAQKSALDYPQAGHFAAFVCEAACGNMLLHYKKLGLPQGVPPAPK